MSITHPGGIILSTRLLSLVLPVILGLFLADPGLAQSSRAGTGEVIAIRELELKPGVDPTAFERFVREIYNPGWEGAVPGVQGYIAKADRGARKGSYVHVFVFDSERTRNLIAPTEGGSLSETFLPIVEKPLRLNQELDRYVEPGWAEAYSDYVVLR